MKLIITGATGFVATEVVRQALLLPSITSVVAIARNSVPPPEGLDASHTSKLKSVVVPDYGSYPDDVKKELQGADACIWTVAITPSKSMQIPFETVRKVCQEWTLAGFQALLEANPKPQHPLRFVYMSGVAARDPAHPRSKEPEVWTPQKYAEYCKMRGETATSLFEIANEQPSCVEVCVAKPGFITGGPRNITRNLFGTALWLTGVVPTIDIKEVSAAMLHHAVHGFEGTEGILLNAQMAKTGREILNRKEKE